MVWRLFGRGRCWVVCKRVKVRLGLGLDSAPLHDVGGDVEACCTTHKYEH